MKEEFSSLQALQAELERHPVLTAPGGGNHRLMASVMVKHCARHFP